MASNFWNKLANDIENGIEYSLHYLMSDQYWGLPFAGFVADKIITPDNLCKMMSAAVT